MSTIGDLKEDALRYTSNAEFHTRKVGDPLHGEREPREVLETESFDHRHACCPGASKGYCRTNRSLRSASINSLEERHKVLARHRSLLQLGEEGLVDLAPIWHRQRRPHFLEGRVIPSRFNISARPSGGVATTSRAGG